MEEVHVHALDYLSVFRRRKWWLITPIVASIAVGAALVRYLPKQYRSSATIAVVSPVVSPNFVGPATPMDNQERLRAVSQELLSIPVLTRVVREEKLVAGAPDDVLLAKVREAVSISVPEPVASFSEPRQLDTFVVSYTDGDPARAQRVANRLANVFVDVNSKTREQRAEDTSAFITSELAASQKRLAALEAQLRRAKESFIGQLPEQTPANLQTLTGLRTQLDAHSTALRGEQDRLSMIERQIDSMKQGASDLFIPRPGTPVDPSTLNPEARVVALQRELAAAKLTYTEKHPEVVRLQEELATAKKEAAADRARPAEDRTPQLMSDPTYRGLVSDREMARLRIRDLERAEEDVRRQIKLYQARVESAPMVEQRLTSVQRDYDLERQQYGELNAKLRAATIAESVERKRRGEGFGILYSANLPISPVKPVPLRVMLLSIAAGICAGAALTLGREYLDRSVHDVRELRDELDLPVLGEVTRIQPV
jgi:polysaccharide chain length determinant protein (PEP-CTERM system associated)